MREGAWGDILAPEMDAPSRSNGCISPSCSSLADDLQRRGLALPVTVLLRVIRPLGFVCSQALLALEPLVGPAAGRYSQVLADDRALDELISLLNRSPQDEGDAKGG